MDRREMLVGSASLLASGSLLSLGGCSRAPDEAQSFDPLGAPPPDRGGILVLLELVGGCDPLSMLVPYRDDEYYRRRPSVGIAPEEVLAIDDERGLHPGLRGLRTLLDRGRLSLVQGVGYPEPFYSHFRSQEVWHTGRLEGRASGDGWIGRLRDHWKDDAHDPVVHVGSDAPYSLQSSRHAPLSFQTPATYQWYSGEKEQLALEAAAHAASASSAVPESGTEDVLARIRAQLGAAQKSSQRVLDATSAYKSRVEYPATPFAASLRSIAALIQSGFGARVYSLSLANFDSHGETMKRTYAKNLSILDGGLAAFLDDLEGSSAEAGLLVLGFTEFGRRVEENQSHGTDHGAATLTLLAGKPVRPGIHGTAPSLTELDPYGNLAHSIDFRRIYSTIVKHHFGVPPGSVLGEDWPALPLLQA